MIKPEDVTIIIPHLGGSPEAEYAFKQCFQSLKETVPDIRIIVVKNGLTKCDHLRHIGILDQGQCKAVNAAAATVPSTSLRTGNTPWIFVTNDDMIYPPGWFEKLTDWFDGFRTPDGNEIMCISPQLVEPRKGAPTFLVEFCGGAGGDFDKQKWLEFVEKHFVKDPKFPDFEYPMTTGFNLPFLIKKELWDLIGGYDINYDPWGSNGDSDLEYKIRLAGVQPYQNTNCIVYHFSQTSGTFHPDNQSYWQKNWDYFIEKWGFPRTDDGIWEANFKMPETPLRKFRPLWEATYGDVNPV